VVQRARRYADVFPIRATTYILTLLNTQLGQGGSRFFLHKRYGLPSGRSPARSSC
jgi:hypothetical protein